MRKLLLLSYLLILSNLSQAQTHVQTLDNDEYQIQLNSLNPGISSWYILTLKDKRTNAKARHFHLEVPTSLKIPLKLETQGLSLAGQSCPLWSNSEFDITKVNFKKYSDPYYPLCGANIFVRLEKPSNTTISTTENLSEFLRKNFSPGESMINAVKPFLVSLDAEAGDVSYDQSKSSGETKTILPTLLSYPEDKTPYTQASQLGIRLRSNPEKIAYGKWYESQKQEGVYVSIMQAQWIDSDIKSSFADRTSSISKSELDKTIYMVAYDLDKFQIEYVAGLEQPGLKDTNALKEKLVAVGNVPSYRRKDTVGVFIGGFQSRHGKIKYGPLKGSEYGYIQNGVVMDELSEGLATFVSTGDQVDIQSWQTSKNSSLAITSARQNGVPLVEDYKPHPYVNKWGWGNWSGDAQGRLQSLRSAICIQENGNKRHLIFAAFTSATPSTMAKTLQAYQCKTAMHLDMNAYMYVHNALIDYKTDNKVDVEYLHQDMEYPKGLKNHRYILDNNRRDFFYVYKK